MTASRGILSSQFILAGAILLLVSTVITSWISLRAEYRAIEARHRTTIERTERWLPLLERAVWVLSEDEMELITRAIAQQEGVEALTLEVSGGETITIGEPVDHHRVDVGWAIRHRRGDELPAVGRLTISMHEPTLTEVTATMLPDLLRTDLLKGLIVIAPFVALVHFGITRQLNRLTASVGKLGETDAGAVDRKVSLSRRRIFASGDEFDELVDAFNRLLAGIRDERRMRSEHARALEKALERSEFLLREVHHRVKNNLQMLISLFNLQAERLPERERAVMLDAERRIRSLALVHIQLYQDENITTVELVTYSEALLNSLTAAGRIGGGPGIRVAVRGRQTEVSLDKAIPLALVLNELGTNAIKHAFAPGEPGEIAVEVIQERDGCLVVSFADDGCGVSEGFSVDASANFGLTVVETLLAQIDASIRYEPRDALGARFVVTVPL